jgi:hypothetical protein
LTFQEILDRDGSEFHDHITDIAIELAPEVFLNDEELCKQEVPLEDIEDDEEAE